MTFLEICKRLRQEVAGAGTGPSTVVAQTGELGRIVAWAATADEDVQRLHNEWRWMVGSFTIDTVIGDNSYLPADCIIPITNLRDWRRETLKIYTGTVANESRLLFIDYQNWYDTYDVGIQTNQRPINFTVGNDQSLKIGPAPNDVYRISGEYQKAVTTMALDADVPQYPSEYHMLPVYLGMMSYGRYTGANEVYVDGENRYKRMIKQMERTHMPRFTIAEPLV